MRKFKVKNRPKRKYTRKTEHQYSNDLLTKSIFVGIIPLIVVAIALYSTLLISQNLRVETPTIELPTYQPPTISFSWDWSISIIANISLFLEQTKQSLTLLGTQTVIYTQALGVSLGTAFVWIAAMLDPRPLFIILGQGIYSVSVTIFQIFQLVMQTTQNTMQVYATVLWETAQFIFQIVGITISYIIHFIAIVLNTLWDFAIATSHVIASWAHIAFVKLVAMIDATLYFLGTPFRALAAFWIQIKPYVDVLLAHVQMTFNDFNNGVKSLNSLTSLKP